jgi:hypothetical protein
MTVDTAFAIVAVCDPAFATHGTFVPSIRSYAARHGHTLVLHERSLDPARHTAYSKIIAVQRALDLPVGWIWSVDCDALVVDAATPLSAVLGAALDATTRLPPSNVSLILSYQAWSRTRMVEALGRRGHPINTGSFFLRNDAWARGFVREWDAASRRRTHMLWDQDALLELEDFVPPPLHHRAPWALGGGRGVALADAPFNMQLCPAAASSRVFLVHLVRSRASLGRCDPNWTPHLPAGHKGRLLAGVARLGQPLLTFICCHKLALGRVSRGQVKRAAEEVWRARTFPNMSGEAG